MPQATKSRLQSRLLWATALVVLVLVILGLRLLLRENIVVRTAAVTYQSLVSTLSTNGKVEPILNFEAHSPYPATVKRLLARQGDHVPAGKLLLSLDDADARARLATAMSGVQNAQLALQTIQHGGSQEERLSLENQLTSTQMLRDQAARDLASLQSLRSSGAASDNEVNNAQQRLKQADNSLQLLNQRKTSRYSASDLERAEAQVADAKAAYAAALSVMDQANVRAPFAGTVYDIPVQQSDFVASGETLLKLADLSRLRVRAFFDEPEIGKLAPGQPVMIVWDAKPGMSWHGHVERTPSTIIRYGTRNVAEVLITVDDADGVLLPNTNVTVTVTIVNLPNVLSIPREALRTEGSNNFVFKLVDNKVVRTPVQVGQLNLTNVQILGGLKENDIVALGAIGGQILTDGTIVHVTQ